MSVCAHLVSLTDQFIYSSLDIIQRPSSIDTMIAEVYDQTRNLQAASRMRYYLELWSFYIARVNRPLASAAEDGLI